jgi:methyl-accepting chemotaxis protein
MAISVRNKLFILVAGGVATSAVVGGISLYSQSVTQATVKNLTDTTDALHSQGEADMMHDALRADVLASYNASSPKDWEDVHSDIEEHTKTFNESVEALEKMPLPADIAADLQAVKPTLKEYIESAKSTIEATNKDHATGVARYPKFEETFKGLEVKLGSLGDKINNAAKAAHEEQVKSASQARWMLLVTFGVSAIGLATFAVGIVRGILGSLNRCLDIANKVAEGDLRNRVNLQQNDEFGALAAGFDRMIGNMSSLLKQITDAAGFVNQTSSGIASSSNEMDNLLSSEHQRSEQIAAAVAELTASVSEIATKSEGAAAAAASSGSRAEQGGKVVAQTVDAMREIADQVNSSAQGVATLGKRSEEIGQIIGVINDIADQTNLLALNAAIEAARAGEHGRGFAVVADEVRKLAERTTKATEEVSQSIRQIQSETQAAVARMNESAKSVSDGMSLANAAGQSLHEIVSSSGEVKSMVAGVAATTEQQSAASEQISESIQQITLATRESSTRAREAASQAQELQERAMQLTSAVAKFKFAS